MLQKELAGGSDDDHGSYDVAFGGAHAPHAPRTCEPMPPFPLGPLPSPPVNKPTENINKTLAKHFL